MKKILVINPNTSKSMTDHIRQELEQIKHADTELTVTCPDKGPETIESAYEKPMPFLPHWSWFEKQTRKGIML